MYHWQNFRLVFPLGFNSTTSDQNYVEAKNKNRITCQQHLLWKLFSAQLSLIEIIEKNI
jgi:hypothetical protein